MVAPLRIELRTREYESRVLAIKLQSNIIGAEDENRTRIICLEDRGPAIKRPRHLYKIDIGKVGVEPI